MSSSSRLRLATRVLLLGAALALSALSLSRPAFASCTGSDRIPISDATCVQSSWSNFSDEIAFAGQQDSGAWARMLCVG